MTFLASAAYFTWLSLWHALGIPPTRIPVDGIVFLSYVLPPLGCYFIVAVMAVTPQTRAIRVILWPLVALLALRAALSVSLGEQKGLDSNFALVMFSVAVRSLNWTLSKGPLVRHLRPANSSPSTIMDAIDLAFNFRGHGWDWSYYKSYIPRDSRPANRTGFVFFTLLSVASHTLVCGVVHRAILTLTPVGVGPIPEGSTIFDETLSPLARYLRSSIISAFTAAMIYCTIRMAYDFCTILAILLLGQDPAQWPPAFDAPWCATSLSDLWGRRWHQFFRHIFLLGGFPLYFVVGRAGVIIGAFLMSVLWHYISVVMYNGETEIWWMLIGFGMMAPGILAERAFRRLTGRRVRGVAGWVWTMAWLLVWGNVIVEGFARSGLLASSSVLDRDTPLRSLAERLATDFDVWLHTI